MSLHELCDSKDNINDIRIRFLNVCFLNKFLLFIGNFYFMIQSALFILYLEAIIKSRFKNCMQQD